MTKQTPRKNLSNVRKNKNKDRTHMLNMKDREKRERKKARKKEKKKERKKMDYKNWRNSVSYIEIGE